MSVRANITGPFAEVTVGAGRSAVNFNPPKELLCNSSSTYLRAALKNDFSESTTQRIVFNDDDPDIFRTYAVWLLQGKLKRECLEEVSQVECHLFHVHIFADKRGIVNLANGVVTMMASYWNEEVINMIVTRDCLPLISSQSTLYQLALDSLNLESRSMGWDEKKWKKSGSHSQDVMLELFQKERHFPDSFQDPERCFRSICRYHEHNDDVIEQASCVRRERGCNTWVLYTTDQLRQVEWKW